MKAKLLITLCSFIIFLTGCTTDCNGCYTNYSYNGTCCVIPNTNGASECDFSDIASIPPASVCGYPTATYYGCNSCVVNAVYDTGRCSSCRW